MKLITLEAARDLVDRTARDTYAGPGSFYVSPYGRTGSGLAAFYVGAREWLEDRDRDFQIFDSPIYFVNLKSGAVSRAAYLVVRELVDDMEPFGDWPIPPAPRKAPGE